MSVELEDIPFVPEEHYEHSLGDDWFDKATGQFCVLQSFREESGDESEDETLWYQEVTKEVYRSILKERGLCPICNVKKDPPEVMSKVELAIMKVSQFRVVEYALPLAGRRRGVYGAEGFKYLVTRDPDWPKPRGGGDWPVIREFLESRFQDGQLDYVLGYWKRTIESLNEGEPSLAQALGLGGEAGCGKTCFKDLFAEATGGQQESAYDWMIGRDLFNKGLATATVWTGDDENVDTRIRARQTMGSYLKKVCANTSIRIRGMFRDGMSVCSLKRLVIAFNIEPDKVAVLPPPALDVLDKMLVLKVSDGPWPMPMSTPREQRAFFQAMVAELPYFHHWLLNEYVLPAELRSDRYGIRHYIHPEIMEALAEMSPASGVLDLIDRHCFTYGKWEGRSGDLRAYLLSDDAGLTQRELQDVPRTVALGRYLGELQRQCPERISSRRLSNGTHWTILPPPDPEPEEVSDGR